MRREFWFHLYYGMGSARSLPRVLEYGRSVGIADIPSIKSLRIWSAKFKWGERMAGIDAEIQSRVAVAQQVRAVDDQLEINHRQAVLGRAIQQIGARAMDLGFGQNVPRLSTDVSLDEAARVIERGAKLERLASGLATERSEMLIGIWSVVVAEIAPLFNRVNAIENPEQRKAEFAHGFDQVMKAHVAGMLSAGREEET